MQVIRPVLAAFRIWIILSNNEPFQLSLPDIRNKLLTVRAGTESYRGVNRSLSAKINHSGGEQLDGNIISSYTAVCGGDISNGVSKGEKRGSLPGR